MPWGPGDAARHTKKAAGHPRAQRAFAHAANSVLESTGDEGRAVRAGNAAVNASLSKSAREGHGTRESLGLAKFGKQD
jgi:hypothetical protein